MSPVDPFDDASTARAVIDDRGNVVRWGAGARRLLGYEAAEAVGRPAADFLADADADVITDADADGDVGASPLAVPVGPRWSGTLALRHRDGHTVSVWLLALRRPPHGWQAVVPPATADLHPPDDALTSEAMRQSPCPMLVCDRELRLRWINDRMAELIDLPTHPVTGLRITDIGVRRENAELEEQLNDVLATGRPRDIENYLRPSGLRNASAHLTRLAPLTDAAGRVQGVCLTGHDFTEHYLARERLRLVNEASLSIGTTLDVTRTAQELARFCVPALADFVSVDLLDPQDGVEPPARFAPPVRLRRTAHDSVSPGTPEAVARPGEAQDYPAGSPQADSLVAGRSIVRTVAGGELDAWLTWDTARAARVRELGIHGTMSVPIRARGVTLGVAVLTRFRRPDPFTPDDVLLAEEVTARAAVCIDNARRYSRERETALALQRSLLPRTLPRTAAVEAASRYLPAARAGVGGDWFDVIPLSGMRVAMVVGDVVGHGVQASATMGRLRTAVRTLADIDLAPEELLTHLDDLVLRLSEEAGGEGSPGEVGATCLYAVYDPVSRRCVLARAGHPPPVVLRADGMPRQVELPAGPPLGLGGLPFESAELELAEGSVLAFYTDGLIESRERDVDTGHRLLSEALAAHSDSLDETCDRILHTLLPPGGAADDVALLLARTRGLPASQVATWDIPADPALVAPIRKQVVEQLSNWELSQASFTTELVVSELVTNAIRYGSRPIRLRLIHDTTTLICEVSDNSHTAPHLRRAKTWDEGGRGLLLVAQLTQRWGSRHTPEGKTIWAELSLFEEE
ncbi:SpoIIE family protein phosphatase [Streptomyces sp. NPDC050263]|uniref:SpoIIE family protein phosphatase n=1 Tax=Streptomyces sp. NPDC050263 TaxID=3155037 RepID=UPI003433C6FC